MLRARIPPWVVDLLGLGGILLVLLDYLRPPLLLLPTIAAGGDTPCHYPTAAYFATHLLPRLRLHGWYPGAYLGHPLLLYYFPLPFLVMAALAPITGMPVAFKLGGALGVFLLPLLAYASFRLMGFRSPGPLLGAGAAFVFLLVEDNPIWGGTLASTLTGEFSYTYGIALGLLFLGAAYRAYSRGKGILVPAALLALTASAHGYAVLWAGLSAAYFLYASRRPALTLAWLLKVAAAAFALAGVFLVPLLADWGWTTPYDDAWITVGFTNLFPPLLWPLFVLALLGLGGELLASRLRGGFDHRILFLAHASLVGAGLYLAGPALGIIDVRFAPFAQLSLALVGAASLALALGRLRSPGPAALGILILAVLGADERSHTVRYWVEYNDTGLEAKEQWPAFRALADRLAGTVSDPRVAVEYSQEHEKAGSIRMYETLPFFSGRSTLEGVYNQASVQTHEVYYLASELSEHSPNPFRSRDYATLDTESAIRHLRLFNASEIVALSATLTRALEARADVEWEATIPPYTLFRLKDPGTGYVEPLAYAPVRSSRTGWRDKAWRWFSRKPESREFVVYTDDPRFPPERDEWLTPTRTPLEGGVVVTSRLEDESLTLETSRVGHPLLVKVSYHPRWRAEGADGPYLVSPALMLVVPRQKTVRLYYARTWADDLGLALTVSAAGLLLFLSLRRRRPAGGTDPVLPADACDLPPPGRKWGGILPGGLLALMVAARIASSRPSDHEVKIRELYERASQAYAAERYADAADYARGALTLRPSSTNLRVELSCLRGESLLRAGEPREAAASFQDVLASSSDNAYVPEALFGAFQASTALGDLAGAGSARKRLLAEFPTTPWAERIPLPEAPVRP